MGNLFTNRKFALSSGQVVSGIAGSAQELRIHGGRVWLTVEGSPDDYFLLAGDRFVVSPGRFTVVEAEQDVSIELRRTPALPSCGGVRAALARITRRLAPATVTQASLPGLCPARGQAMPD